jgi:C-terminal processing protease CtpA/Prc
MRPSRHALVAALIALLGGTLATPAAAQIQEPPCTTIGKVLFVRDVLNDLYYWYHHLPNVDAASFASPEAYLDAVRYRPLDEHFSYIAPRAATEAFFSDSQFIGFGFTMAFDGDLRIAEVMPDSPAQEANLTRGDRIAEINGRTVADLVQSGGIEDAFGPDEVGVRGELVVVRGGTRYRAAMTKRAVTIPTVSATRVYPVAGRDVGYVFFRNFVEPSYAALDTAFADLRGRGVKELVLDLRYNGGGLVEVAQHLASLIGGTRTEGQVFAEFFHNDRNAALNESMRFKSMPGALTLERLIVITTQDSASASELVINALKPFMPVLVVGDRTFGKPVGQYGIPFCDKVLAPVAFTVRNARGEGDFFDGIPAMCTASDDLDHQIGDTAEASLHEALAVAATGRCSSATSLRPQAARPSREGPQTSGWQSIVNAH